jgi:hypothetical protein
MTTDSISDTNGPGSPFDPFPTPRIFPDKWDLSELAPGYHSVGEFTPASPPAGSSGGETHPMTDGFTDESAANAL